MANLPYDGFLAEECFDTIVGVYLPLFEEFKREISRYFGAGGI